MAVYKTKSGSFTYSGNPDFRGYLASNAPEFLPYVGAGTSGNTYQDYGINMKALRKAGGVDSNYAQKSLTPEGVGKYVNELWTKYSSMSSAPQIQDSAGTGGGGGGYGYGYGATNPLAETYAGQRNDVRSRLQAAIDAYNVLSGKAQTAYSDQTNKLKSDYQAQREKLSGSFQKTGNLLANQYMARGLGDSSFYANAQGDAINSYNADLGTVNKNETQSMSDLGAKLQTARAQYESAKGSYQDYINRLGTFGGSELGGIMNQAQMGIQNATQSAAGMGTQAENLAAIQNVAPIQLNTSELQTKLQNIQNSGTTDFAKQQIAKGLINQSVGDNKDQETYWTNYYNNLKSTGRV